MIEIDRLVKSYGGRTVVDHVSLTVTRGEIFGILGPNGAGKTTTVECLLGLRTPDSGRIRVGGMDLQHNSPRIKHMMGAQLQESELPDKLKVGEAMRLHSSFYREPADWRELLEALHLAEMTDTQFRHLSGGQKQRLSIALAVIGNPQIAVLDELTTGLDPQARRDTWQLIERIRDRGVTVLLVTHFMEEAERLCDRLAVIDSGRVVALDSPSRLIAAVDGAQRIRFRPSAPLDPALLRDLPPVITVQQSGDQIMITGTMNALPAAITLLNQHGVAPIDLRVEQPTLDDAFVALTGRPIEN